MRLNNAGRMVERWWAELTNKFPSVETNEYIVMPNHVHGIIGIVQAALPERSNSDTVGAALCGRPAFCPRMLKGAHTGAPLRFAFGR